MFQACLQTGTGPLPLTSSTVAGAWLISFQSLPSATSHKEQLAQLLYHCALVVFLNPQVPLSGLDDHPPPTPSSPSPELASPSWQHAPSNLAPHAAALLGRAGVAGGSWSLCAVLASATFSFDVGSCPSVSLATRLWVNTITGKPQTQLSTGTMWARQPRLGGMGHSTLWLCGYCTIVWLCGYCNRWVLTAELDYKPLVAVSPAFRKGCVCVCVCVGEREKPAFSVFTTNSCSKAVRATFGLRVAST